MHNILPFLYVLLLCAMFAAIFDLLQKRYVGCLILAGIGALIAVGIFWLLHDYNVKMRRLHEMHEERLRNERIDAAESSDGHMPVMDGPATTDGATTMPAE